MARTRHGQSGQAAVLAALCLFTMLLFLAMASNVGILVTDRIRMQNTADLAAYAGAFEQARSLNYMADRNKRIFDTVSECRHILATTLWTQCDDCECNPHTERDAEAFIAECEARIEDYGNELLQANQSASTLAYQAALFTAERNLKGVGNHFDNFGDLEDSPTWWSKSGLVAVDRYTEVKVNYQFSYCCRSSAGQCMLVNEQNPSRILHWDAWFYKSDPESDMVYFPVRVMGVPMGRFLDLPRGGPEDENGQYFSASTLGGRNPLAGYAVAKPFGGNLGPDWDTSEGLANILYGWVYDDYSAEELKPHFSSEYRARIAGLTEPLEPAAVELIASELEDDGVHANPYQVFAH